MAGTEPAGAEPLIALTDEEIAALDGGPDADHVAPRPWLDTQDEPQHNLICQVALRGLAARGLAVPRTDADGDPAVAAAPDLAQALALRKTAPVIVIAQRRTTADSVSRVLYAHPATVLEEDITPGGLHGFILLAAGLAAVRLTRFVVPPGIAREHPDPDPRVIPLTDIATGTGIDGLEDTRHVTALARVARDTEQQRLTVYALSDKVVLAEPGARDGQPVLTLTETSEPRLTGTLATLLTVDAED
jgi:hypothetical protein